MKLSVVIVNYNVKAFLEQCLRSVTEALKGIEAEIFVVDNQSTDGSVDMLRSEFPTVRVLANTVNVGFSRANNQAIRVSTGEYVLLLNPDTVVGEDVFRKVIAFMDGNSKVGGLGVKMIDGTGRFLPESKRGLPTPTVAFFKIMGLARLFPHSRNFGRYHLGHLPEDSSAPIEILSGACMFMRRSVLDEVGLLDESFFMYGEDIDLSYRICLGGYENWYFPEARIIHYKGESTKKSSVNYVFVFYNAMVIFARKHFTRRGPQFFSYIIRGAIYLSAAAAIVVRFIHSAFFPMVDLFILVACMMAPPLLGLGGPLGLAGLLPTVVVSMACLAAFGAYDLPTKPLRTVVGTAVAVGILYGGQALGLWSVPVLPAIVVAGLLILAVRLVSEWLGVRRSTVAAPERTSVLVIGSEEESRAALDLLWQTHFGLKKSLSMDPAELVEKGRAKGVEALIRKEGLDEVVFCSQDLRMQDIIEMLEELRTYRAVTFKIAQPGASFIIGPGTTESLQDLYILRNHAVNNSSSIRRRKLLDATLSLVLLPTLPITIWLVKDKAGFIRNLFGTLSGKYTWVGYASAEHDLRIPRLKPGVLNPLMAEGVRSTPLTVKRTDLEYAKDYRVWTDLGRILANFSALGSPPAA